MIIFILAAGDAERWDGEVKQLKEVRGETVLGRTVRMLEGVESDRIVIVSHNEQILDTFTSRFIPENHDKLLNTVMSTSELWEGHDEVMFLLGDVVWTKAALDKVLEPIDKSCQFYGSWDEHFAFRFTKEMYEQVSIHISKILIDGMEGTTWQLYRSIAGIPLRQHWIDTWWRTLIDDKTDDIDYPDDYQDKINTGYFDDKEFDT